MKSTKSDAQPVNPSRWFPVLMWSGEKRVVFLAVDEEDSHYGGFVVWSDNPSYLIGESVLWSCQRVVPYRGSVTLSSEDSSSGPVRCVG